MEIKKYIKRKKHLRPLYLLYILIPLLYSGCYENIEVEMNENGKQKDGDWIQEAQRIVDSYDGGVTLFDTEPLWEKSAPNITTRANSNVNQEIDWKNYISLQEGEDSVIIVPINHKTRVAKILLNVNGRSKRTTNKVVSKLIIRKNKNRESPLIIIGTYIAERNYFENYEEEFAKLNYNFKGTHFNGYFIASRMDGSMISGTKLQNGEEVFRFMHKPMSVRNPKLTEEEKQDIHLCLNIISAGNGLKKSPYRKAAVKPEEGEIIYCSLCHKPDLECTCIVVYAKCNKCGKKLAECTCNNQEECEFCHQKRENGTCKCCPVCHTYPCLCERNPRDKPETGGGNGNGGRTTTTTGGGAAAGFFTGGGTGGNVNSTRVSAEKITKAAPLAVQRASKRRGNTTSAACNFGVQEMFKELYGFLPKGMNVRANEMVAYWRSHPESWKKIELSQAQQLANQGYFVVAGYIAPQGSGHVVVIVPGEGRYSGSWKGWVPNTMDTGAGQRESKTTLNRSFGIDKKSKVEFYYYK